MIILIEYYYSLLPQFLLSLQTIAYIPYSRMHGGNNTSSNTEDLWMILVIIVLVIVLFYYLATRNEIKPFQFHKKKRNNRDEK